MSEGCLGVEEDSTATQILGKPGHSLSFAMNRHGQMEFKALRATAFQTIGVSAHTCPSESQDLRRLTVSRIRRGWKLQLSHGAELWKYGLKVNIVLALVEFCI